MIRVVVGTTITLWVLACAVLGVILASHPKSFTSIAAVGLWLCALALGATVTSAAVICRTQRSTMFEHGYLAGLADGREPKVVSMASHHLLANIVNGHSRNTNKVS